MTPKELKDTLNTFTGTEGYHRFSILFRNVLLTDGAHFLADEAGAYWLMDVIASHLSKVPAEEHLTIAHLSVHPERWATFRLLGDIDEKRDEYGRLESVEFIDTYAEQHIDYTDFPLDEIKLYVVRQDWHWVVLLPSEY